MVYYKIVVKENFRKQWLLFLSVIHFEKTIYLRKHESITEFRYISTEGHLEKQVFNPFDFPKVLIDESNDPDVNFFNDKAEAVDS